MAKQRVTAFLATVWAVAFVAACGDVHDVSPDVVEISRRALTTARFDIETVPAVAWRVVGVFDYDRDYTADLAWRRATEEGEVRIWRLEQAANGGFAVKPNGDFELPNTRIAGWKVVGMGDFDGDRVADLAWRRTADVGEVRVWLLTSQGTCKPNGDIGLPASPAGFVVLTVTDFDGDGLTDVVWRRPSDEATRVWLLDRSRVIKTGGDIELPSVPGSRIIAVGDFDGNGRADLALRPASDEGEISLRLRTRSGAWEPQLVGIGAGAVAADETVVGSGTFNAIGRADPPAALLVRKKVDPLVVSVVRIYF